GQGGQGKQGGQGSNSNSKYKIFSPSLLNARCFKSGNPPNELAPPRPLLSHYRAREHFFSK
ncbi:hypothetical protein, partial [Chroococcidiopsis cubana]|uniref:hypothetical protein n=1 Tax=Chroococcidiopsis cubana TaxID=171392 RepID=UPI001C63AA60